jgi:hypothetical protein
MNDPLSDEQLQQVDDALDTLTDSTASDELVQEAYDVVERLEDYTYPGES